MASYTAIHLAERPTDNVVPGQTFAAKQHTIPDAASLQDGEVLFKTLYLSLDPAMRGWLKDRRSYLPPVQIGEVMRGMGVGLIVASKAKNFPVGSYATGGCSWSEYAVLSSNKPDQNLQSLDLPKGAVPTDALGVLGMTALTAYFGMLDVGQVKEGDLVVVSAAAGATGSVAGQIAKIKGARVLGLAGGDDKVRWLKEELGFDDALDYKDPDFRKKFREATKDLIDVYFDNVGGEILDLMLKRLKRYGRISACGGVSTYNNRDEGGIKNWMEIVTNRLQVKGFIVTDAVVAGKTGAMIQKIVEKVKEGKIKIGEDSETVVPTAVEDIPKTWSMLFSGGNQGKLVTAIKH